MSTPDTLRRLDRDSVVFTYSAEHPPAVTIAPGERLLVETQWAFGDQHIEAGMPLSDLDTSRCDPLTGPIFVEGAEPGDTLAVTIHEMSLVAAGGQGIIPGLGVLPWEDLPVDFFEPENGAITWLRGIRIPIRPNLGCMGVAPAGDLVVPSIEPGDHGGNLDCRYICAGSTILFPVAHPGALLVMGDAHQMQGDGELCGVAPETASDVELSCEIRRDWPVKRPQIFTPERFMTLASAKTLEEAISLATGDFVDVLVTQKGFSRDEAYLLTALEAHAEICQVVNPLMTARVAMDRAFFDAL